MISWQVTLDGKLPEGWDPRTDDCWFPDFDLQRYLLPYFDVGDQPIDEYGGTVFDTSAVMRLRAHLEWHRAYIEAKGESVRITITSGGQSESYEIKRDAALEVIDKTLRMIERAIELKGQIIFLGD